jgi:hypothetical protein
VSTSINCKLLPTASFWDQVEGHRSVCDVGRKIPVAHP